ncbi:MAG: N6-L-threonylcarbamoyladenine synthase [Paracoccaceae bacterium]|jgi:N6-L-threonylcarbamoyladenine synthase
MPKTLNILGLESSCDDTAAAVLRHSPGENAVILSSVVFGQFELHQSFGGVVPEIAARAHAEKLDHCVEDALLQANLKLRDIDAIAVTAGPGLIGGVLSGVMCARGLAAGANLPLIGVNHLAGHALTSRMTDQLPYPYLTLLISGGHCQFLIVRGFNDFSRLGGTIDDAPGEAFDKTARLLGLPQPGGPSVELAAKLGDPNRFKLPRPLLDRAGCDMSFSGLKTALRRARDGLIKEHGGLTKQDVSDLAAGFQAAVCDVLAEKSRRAMRVFLAEHPSNTAAFSVVGGVAANQAIRVGLTDICRESGFEFFAPPLQYCTDNAAMIAWVGLESFRAGKFDETTLTARPRWPLDDKSEPMLGSGKKGAKA